MPTIRAVLFSANNSLPTSTSAVLHDQEPGSNAEVDNGILDSRFAVDARLVRMVLAEAIGTFILVFCISGIIANLHFMGIQTGLIEYALTAGLTVVVVVFSIGSISGAHVNPAVTVAFAIFGPFPWSKVPFYVIAQVGGAVLGTYIGGLVYGIKPELMITKPLIHGWAAAFSVELIASFIILFVMTSLFNEPQSLKVLPGFLAGVAICLGVLITGPVSGGSMNPARSLGPALVSWRFDHLWIYLVAPTLGAISGVLVYRALRVQGWSCDSDPSYRTVQVTHSSPQ